MAVPAKSVYDFDVLDGKRQKVSMKQFAGNVLLIYNVASKCGLTDGGYTTAQTLYSKYKDKGLIVLGFPCNQFGGQEPGTEEEIQQFACTKFKAEFPLMGKVDVNGITADPLWEFMKKAQPGIFGTLGIKWNFSSFLVDRQGQVVERFSPGENLDTIEKKLVGLL